MRNHIFLYLNGKALTVHGQAAFKTLAEFLRHDCGLTGTKVACGEGACGSCTVLIGEPSGNDAAPLAYKPINACLLRVFQTDCRHVITIEGMGDADGSLSPVQRALAENNGAQCGFCTPGVIASLTLLAGGGPLPPCAGSLPTDADCVRESLSGNLCRCTGYLPIYRSAEKIAPPEAEWHDPYPSLKIARELTEASGVTVWIADGDQIAYLPMTLDEALSDYAESHEDEVTGAVVSGGTDPASEAERLFWIGHLPELRTLTHEDSALLIGAAVTWAELAEFAREPFPELARFLGQFGAPQVRALGTVGGSVAASAYNGDILPLLLIQNAILTLQSTAAGIREVSYADFLLQDGCHIAEILTHIRLPLPAPGERLHLYKVRRRQAFDRSVFCAAVTLRLSEAGTTIVEARVAAGGIASRPMRLPACEAALTGAPFTLETMHAAGDAAASEIAPKDDAYASASYRRQLVRNLPLRVFYSEGEASI